MNQEQAKCDWCGEMKPVSRQYVRVKNRHFDDNKQGTYSNFFRYCEDCGVVISDGYHTFDELYDHRATLYIALCRFVQREDDLTEEMKKMREGFAYTPGRGRVWRSKLHSDGSSFDGWYVLGIGRNAGDQITYHLPLARWDETGFADTLEVAPEFDGHTSSDVLERLKNL